MTPLPGDKDPYGSPSQTYRKPDGSFSKLGSLLGSLFMRLPCYISDGKRDAISENHPDVIKPYGPGSKMPPNWFDRAA